jgi:acyl-CoA thioesterase FadM
VPAGTDQVSAERTAVTLRPRAEGANIRTWVGFKHFMYLAEEAVLAWFRERGLGPSSLFHESGLCLSIVDSSVQLPAVLDVDDEVAAEATGGPSEFTVRLRARRPGGPTVLRGRVRVLAVREPGTARYPVPEPLRGCVVDGIGAAGGPDPPDPGTLAGLRDSGLLLWSWRVPYYYCHFSRRIQHSGYVRALEEAVERFLAGRGLSIGTVLDTRGWIPVVSRARVGLLGEVAMEETVHTVLEVVDVLKNLTFEARMDCYVERGGALAHVATGRILHGYAVARGPDAGRLAQLDPATVAALTGSPPR